MSFCHRIHRREFLHQLGGGFTSLALAGMLSRDGALAAAPGLGNPLAPRQPIVPARARSVIFLFMYGGPSHVDTFDHKPKLHGLDGKTVAVKTFGRGGKRSEGRVVGPKWNFRPYGECGKQVSDLFPHLARHVDDIAFVHSMTAESPIHGSAMLMMNSGSLLSGRPSLGSWVNYGLGSLNEDLPGYVVMLDKSGGPISGAKNWTSGYMPASYQGVVFRPDGSPILNLESPPGVDRLQQRSLIDFVGDINRGHLQGRESNSELAARIASYELAYRMQAAAPEAIDLEREPEHVKRIYGIDEDRTEDFGRKCLLARRLVERGVRFIQIYAGGAHNDDNWDAHGDLVSNHEHHAGRTDKPIAGLLADLKQRGLLEETLVVWGGEFGRQPTAEYDEGTGRDHNSYGFTMWMAGGGIKGGTSFGETDELGAEAVRDRVEVKHLHATVLQQMGLDPNVLSYFHRGLDQKLVGVEEVEPIREIIA